MPDHSPPRAGDGSPYSRRLIASVAVLAALAALYSLWPIWRALFPLEISVNEPWNAYQVDALLQGRTLYPDAQSLVTNNYPPLSYYLVGALSAISIDAVFVGRGLSLLSVAVTALAVGACVRLLEGSRLAALVAGLWFVATMVRFFDGYVGVNDPHLPALAVTVTAMAWLLHRERGGRAPEPTILMMALAGFYKHSLIATPVTAVTWLAIRDWRRGLRAALFGAAMAAAGLALCAAVFGYAFIHQLLLYPRAHSIWWAFGNLGQLQWIAPALIIWAVWAWYDRDHRAARFTALYVAASLAAYLVQKLGMSIGVNAQFELTAATAIGLGLAFSRTIVTPFAKRWGEDASRLALLAIVIARLVLSNHVEPYLVVASPDYRRLFSEHAGVMAKEIERVRNTPGQLDCTIISVCRFAGKPFVYDPYAADQIILTGTLPLRELQARLEAQGVRHVPIDPRANAVSLQRRIFDSIR